MSALVRHVRALWPRWALLPPLPFWAYGLFKLARGELRFEHVLLMVAMPLLAYASRSTKRLFVACYPIALVGLLYDAMKLVQNAGVSPSTVHLCDLRASELRWFGLTVAGERITVHDWLQPRAHIVLDAICAIPYGTFLYAAIGFAVFLYFRDRGALHHFAWTFFALNLVAFATYHLYPAAPPWYYHAHGCTVDMTARANEGPNLARVDALLGVHYFAGLYGRSSDVFGAVPSLHVAYPMLILLVGWRRIGWLGRALAGLFFAVMCFAAVYLDHHWIIDVLLGLGYCAIASSVVALILRRWAHDDVAQAAVAPERGVA